MGRGEAARDAPIATDLRLDPPLLKEATCFGAKHPLHIPACAPELFDAALRRETLEEKRLVAADVLAWQPAPSFIQSHMTQPNVEGRERA